MSENIKDMENSKVVKGSTHKKKVYKNEVADRVSFVGTLCSFFGYFCMVFGPGYVFAKGDNSVSSIILCAIITTICLLSAPMFKGLAEVIELLQDLKDK